MDIAEELKQAHIELYGAKKNLKLLGEESVLLMEEYAKATDKEKPVIKEKMRESENKFNHLSQEVKALAEKVKKLKEQSKI